MPDLVRAAALVVLILALAAACGPAAAPATTTPEGPTPTTGAAPTAKPVAELGRAPTATPKPPPTPEDRARNTPTPVAQVPASIRVTQIADGLNLPAGLHFAPDGRLFFNEVKTGAVRIVDPGGTLRPNPFVTLTDVATKATEQGVLGLTLDPDFRTNHYVYVFYTQAKNRIGDPKENRVVRYTERNGVATDQTRILTDLPHGICCHNGGRIGFGPDGKLYITVGDQNQDDRVQKMNHLNGKVLRVNPDGTVPSDNPFPGSPIFALGFRNPWGLAFHPRSGVPYVTDNGEVGHDEVNRVIAGGNYGNPEVDGIANDPRFVDPIWESGVGRYAPTGATFYTGQAMPEYQNDLFFCAFNTGDLTRMRLNGPNFDQIVEQEVLAKNCYLDVANGPDGALYFAGLTGIHRFGR